MSASDWIKNNAIFGATSPGRVPGLAKMLRNGGYQVLSDRPINLAGATAESTPVTLRNSSVLGNMARWRHHAAFASDHIVLVFGNWSGANSGAETPGANPVKIKAALQKNGASGPTDETGVRVAVTFRGQSVGEIPTDGLLFSDPVPFNVAAQELFYVRTFHSVTGTANLLPGGGASTGGGTAAGSANNGEGSAASDLVMGATASTQEVRVSMIGPIAVLGFSPTVQKSVAVLGDSIPSGTADTGHYRSQGGYLERIMVNQTQFVMDSTFSVSGVSNFPYIRNCRAGYSLANFANLANSYKQLKLAELCSTAVVEYGTNDISGTLVAMKANALTVAGWFTARSIKIIWCTLLPRTTSSDSFKTVANQTVTANETTRTGFNSWLRDTSASGFVAQATASGGTAAVWDAAATIEVNASGVSTLNGGFWPAAHSLADLTGTLSAVTSSTNVTDNTKTTTQDQWRGYCLLMTNGTANGQISSILNNGTGGQLSLLSALSPNATVGDAYEVYQPPTIDGTHPTTWMHQQIANGLNTAGNLAMVQ